MKTFRHVLLALGVGALALPVGAQTVVVPNANALVEGANGLNTMVRTQARTIQMIIGASQLSTIPLGGTITGLAFRLDEQVPAQGNQPTFPITFSSYDIYMGVSAVAPGAESATFANNYLAPRQQVRSGALTLGTGFFPDTPGAPNPFSADIAFNAGGFVYNGGDLVLELTHTGNGASDFGLDATPNSASAVAHASVGYNATTSGDINNSGPTLLMPVVRFSFSGTAAPEPGALALMALGAGVLVARRRRNP